MPSSIAWGPLPGLWAFYCCQAALIAAFANRAATTVAKYAKEWLATGLMLDRVRNDTRYGAKGQANH